MWIKLDGEGAFLARSEEDMEIKDFDSFTIDKWFHTNDLDGKIYINGEKIR